MQKGLYSDKILDILFTRVPASLPHTGILSASSGGRYAGRYVISPQHCYHHLWEGITASKSGPAVESAFFTPENMGSGFSKR